jgi:hypothetical protein
LLLKPLLFGSLSLTPKSFCLSLLFLLSLGQLKVLSFQLPLVVAMLPC